MNTLESIEFAQRLSKWAGVEAEKLTRRHVAALCNTAELREAIADALVDAYASGARGELP